MALNKNNLLVKGASGKMSDDFVYRQRAGVTLMTKIPELNKEYEPSEAQKAQKLRFKQGTYYAKNVILDDAIKAAYEAKAKKGESAYNVALKDFLTSPEFYGVQLDAYTGTIGDLLTFEFQDILELVYVKVAIYDADGVLLEEGDAVQDAIFKLNWVYTTTAANPLLPGTRLVAKVKNFPQHIYEFETILE